MIAPFAIDAQVIARVAFGDESKPSEKRRATSIIRHVVSHDAVDVPFVKHEFDACTNGFSHQAATFCLLYAFPLLLLGTYDGTAADIARPIAWAFTIWGTALYLWSGVVYLHQIIGLLRSPVRQPVP